MPYTVEDAVAVGPGVEGAVPGAIVCAGLAGSFGSPGELWHAVATGVAATAPAASAASLPNPRRLSRLWVAGVVVCMEPMTPAQNHRVQRLL
ncbi:hypothetical protein MINS_13670 [Mycolicibacterium insubricum]|nr:hypothetical protein MINS_13670 [Mycolicibacterium insubricum]